MWDGGRIVLSQDAGEWEEKSIIYLWGRGQRLAWLKHLLAGVKDFVARPEIKFNQINVPSIG